jgi:hypothetical protein
MIINYKILSDALDYYQSKGFIYEDVDWVVSEEISNITKPEILKNFPLFDGVLVASAEQSFLQKIYDKQLKAGSFVALTPCFRDEVSDYLHQKYFMKVELIETLDTTPQRMFEIIELCQNFFKQYVDTKIEQTGELMYDIVDSKNGIELGSYGIRSNPLVGTWIYATGVAEPRLSRVIKLQ